VTPGETNIWGALARDLFSRCALYAFSQPRFTNAQLQNL